MGDSQAMGELLGQSPGTSRVPGAAGGLTRKARRTESKERAGVGKKHISVFPGLTPSTHLLDSGARSRITL